MCIIRYCAHYCSQSFSLASCFPCFNLLSFGICSTQCLYRNHFLFSVFFFLNFYYHFLSVLCHAVRVSALRSAQRHADRNLPRGSVTLILISTFLPAVRCPRTGCPFAVACPWRNSCRRSIIANCRGIKFSYDPRRFLTRREHASYAKHASPLKTT